MRPPVFFRSILALFFLSGVSGLIYQVVWVRFFGRIFGNTVYSASLVTAIFMLGLGLGSFFAGRWIDRRADRPLLGLKTYGAFELAIALFGIALSLILPRLEPISAYISWYAIDASGWRSPTAGSYLLRGLLALVLLLPVTTLMGGTLTLLIRHVLQAHLGVAGWRVGALYGVNTLGAGIGAFLTDFALIPGTGLFSTQLAAVLFNLIAAAGAFRIASSIVSPRAQSSAAAANDRFDARVRWVAAAIFVSGAAAMGIEILWFRALSIALGGYRGVFSLLLAVILVSMWLGSLAGGYANKKWNRPFALAMIAQAAVAISTLLLFTAFRSSDVGDALFAIKDEYFAASKLGKSLLTTRINLAAITGLVALPAAAMGAAFPLANAAVHRSEARIGEFAGALYLANTLGALSGSLLTGLWLIPAFGVQTTATVLAAIAGGAIVFLACANRGDRVWLGLAVPVAAAVFYFARLPNHQLLDQLLPQPSSERRLDRSEGVYELIDVYEDANGNRTLATNGHPMSATHRAAQRYMRAFVHVPFLSLEKPTDALVICFGVGSTLNAVSLHPSIERFEIVDLSRHVLEHASYFERTNGRVLEDPRLTVFVNDGRSHLWMQADGRYDLITLEPPPIRFAGVSALYSRDFYELARSKLKPGGYFTQWLPIYQVDPEVALAMVRAFTDAFPNAILLSGSGAELILMGSRSDAPIILDPRLADAKRAANPALAKDLAQVDLSTLTELAGMFVAAPETLREATEELEPVTDDYPIMEYSGATEFYETRIPEILFAPEKVGTWCPDCLNNSRVPRLEEYVAVLGRYYRTDLFLEYRTTPDEVPVSTRIPLPPGITVTSTVIRESSYLRTIYLTP